MNGLSLSPRYDLFRLTIPKGFIPEEVRTKWTTLLSEDTSVFSDPIEYLSESIKGVNLPGLSDLLITQPQTGTNPITPTSRTGRSLGRINREPAQDNVSLSPGNPLSKIERTFRVTFRMNQNLANYWILYESIFYYYLKHISYDSTERWILDLPDETGKILCRIYFEQVYVEGISGIDFSYDKVDRQADTFTVDFHFNNLNIDFPTLEGVAQ